VILEVRQSRGAAANLHAQLGRWSVAAVIAPHSPLAVDGKHPQREPGSRSRFDLRWGWAAAIYELAP
jgi:hypothetical protein